MESGVYSLNDGRYVVIRDESDIVYQVTEELSSDLGNIISEIFIDLDEKTRNDKLRAQNDLDWYEMEMGDMCTDIDESTSLIQKLIVELESGERMNRNNIIKKLKIIDEILNTHR